MGRLSLVLSLSLFCSGWAAAADIVEITHAKVLAKGGYPFVITSRGSYRLGSNLYQPNPNTDVIVIQSSEVVLDLNGFTIHGNNQCSKAPGAAGAVSCSGSGSGNGIVQGDAKIAVIDTISVSNGSIVGMGNRCVDLNAAAHSVVVTRVKVSHCGGDGIMVPDGYGGSIFESAAAYARGYGLWGQQINKSSAVACVDGMIGGVISEAFAELNQNAGILGARVSGSFARGNGGNGIGVDGAAIGNVSWSNGKYGVGGSGAFLSQNSLNANSLGDIQAGLQSLPSNSNMCTLGAC